MSADRSRRAGFCGRFLPKQGESFFDQGICRNAVFLAQNRDGTVLNKFVRPSNPHDRRSNGLRIEMLHYGTAETVMQNVVLNRADDFHTPGEEFKGPSIERFDPS